ncbi:MAG TPA: carboxypeptidase-like regulatory domain-containing protein [Bryobacteraceae bacterium]|nr:carboxypeptidase-like regulatory domain-containing protein [Bryobacteraceae bacterium]
MKHKGSLIAMLLLSFSSANAQSTFGSILGRVLDSSGSAVAGASVRVINRDTGVVVTATANQDGSYEAPYLVPGSYSVSVEHTGFKKFIQQDVTLRVSDRIAVNITLEVGEVTETVNVTDAPPLVETTNASIGSVVDSKRIQDLPLSDGNPFILAHLAPGILNLGNPANQRTFDNDSTSDIAANGTPTRRNEFQLDGVPDTAGRIVAFIPSTDMVREFRVQTASYDAGYGNTPGAIVNVSLKSGTNNVHGSLWENLRNSATDASSFFTNRAGQEKPAFRLNHFGASVGGPVFLPKLYDGRNRTFFFFGFEGLKDAYPQPLTGTVPTLRMREGDFSELLALGSRYQIYDPSTIVPAAGGRFSRQPLPGNLIPRDRLNPTALAYMQYWPEPNQPGTVDFQQNYYNGQRLKTDDFYSYLGRVDHNIGESHRFFARLNYNQLHEVANNNFNNIATGTNRFRKNHGAAIDDVWIASPSTVVGFRYGYTRWSERRPALSDGFNLAGLGFSPEWANYRSADIRTMPPIGVSGMSGLGGTWGYIEAYDTHTFGGNVTKTIGSHSIRFGGDMRVYRETRRDEGNAVGSFNFGTTWTRGPLDNSAAAPTGQGLASFLMGLPDGGNADINASYAEQSVMSSLFIQEDWKATRRLTLNFGLRYELETPITERFNRTLRGFDYDAPSPIEAAAREVYARSPIPEVPVSEFRVRGGLLFAGQNGVPRGLWEMDKNNLQPRIGFAYQLRDATVLRGGYGIFHDFLGLRVGTVDVIQSGYSRRTDFVASLDNGQNFIANLTNPFPNGLLEPLGSSLGLSANLGQAVTFLRTNPKTGYMQRWSLNVQHEIPGNVLIDIGYLGNRGTGLPMIRELNYVPNQYLSTLPVRDDPANNFLTAQVPNPFAGLLPGTSLNGNTVSRSVLLTGYPHFSSVRRNIESIGYSWYHSLQTRVEKRLGSGLVMGGAWTWSKALAAMSFRNAGDPFLEEVLSSQDRTHRLAVNWVYDLPIGRGRRIGSNFNAVADAILGGWQVAGIYQAQSGAPLGIGDPVLTGPFSVTDLILPEDQRIPERYINTDVDLNKLPARAFVSHLNTMSSRFGALRSDGMNQWDISVAKTWRLTESVQLRFQTQFINAFNHVTFSAPNLTSTNTAFGTVTSEASMPRTIRWGLRIEY